ncbi:MAG: hypothetical protein VKS61_07530 [Candidatus Sericytochromatia bacterium]|nr:hypothetical protein [Candidatus Sericytochromatia bacterium]
MEKSRGSEASDTQMVGLLDNPSPDPSTPLTLRVLPEAAPGDVAPLPALDEVPALFLALLGRTEPALSAYEERVVRACLCLAGEQLAPLGGLDPEFYAAVLAFKERQGLRPVDPRLDLPTLTRIVHCAAWAVGNPNGSWSARLRAVTFDFLRAPGLVAEVPGIANLVRELKGGRTRMPSMPPVRLPPEG